MTAPQIIMAILFAIGLLNSAKNHGKPKDGEEDFLVSSVSLLILFAILWWGGFWAIK